MSGKKEILHARPRRWMLEGVILLSLGLTVVLFGQSYGLEIPYSLVLGTAVVGMVVSRWVVTTRGVIAGGNLVEVAATILFVLIPWSGIQAGQPFHEMLGTLLAWFLALYSFKLYAPRDLRFFALLPMAAAIFVAGLSPSALYSFVLALLAATVLALVLGSPMLVRVEEEHRLRKEWRKKWIQMVVRVGAITLALSYLGTLVGKPPLASNLGGGFSPALRNISSYRYTRFSYDIVPRLGYSGFSPYLNLTGKESIHLSEEPALEVTGPPAYWRGVVFHRYTGSAWTTEKIATEDVAFSLEKNGFDVLPWEYRDETTQGEGWLRISRSVKMLKPHANFLFAPWVPGRLSFGSMGTIQSLAGSQVLRTVDGALLTPFLPEEGFTYVIQSISPLTTSLGIELRSPSTELDVLSLPHTLPRRVLDLAIEEGGVGLPKEVMERLALWLGTHTTYSLESDPPPRGVDSVDWFLFESKRGWCEMYASSLAVLGRAVGIPTRVIGGYLGGEKEVGYKGLLIRDSDAHTWVEYWAGKGQGWVPIDPTPESAMVGPVTEADGGGGGAMEQVRRAYRGFTEKLALVAWSNILSSTWAKVRTTLLILLSLFFLLQVVRFLIKTRPWSREARRHRAFRAWERRARRWGLRRGKGETISRFARRWTALGAPTSVVGEASRFEKEYYGVNPPIIPRRGK
ncbi:transglutaminase domain-containing protein [bacterium]|nr:transglutaminase domain-containing protein [bacterium]